MRQSIVFICVLMMIGVVVNGRDYSWETIRFKSDFELSEPVKIGLDAVSFMYPDTSGPEGMLAEIVFVKASKELQEMLEMKEPAVFDYLKTTFLGLTEKPDSKRDRDILGKSVKAELFKHTFPTPADIEAVYLTLQSEYGMMLAFRILPEMPEKDRVKFVDMVFETMTETKTEPTEPMESLESSESSEPLDSLESIELSD